MFLGAEGARGARQQWELLVRGPSALLWGHAHSYLLGTDGDVAVLLSWASFGSFLAQPGLQSSQSPALARLCRPRALCVTATRCPLQRRLVQEGQEGICGGAMSHKLLYGCFLGCWNKAQSFWRKYLLSHRWQSRASDFPKSLRGLWDSL